MRVALTLVGCLGMVLVACHTDENGTCTWAPGADGTCPPGDGCSSSEPPPPRVSFSSGLVSRSRVIVEQGGDEGQHLWTAALDGDGVPTGPLEPMDVRVNGHASLWDGGDEALLTIMAYGGDGTFGVRAMPLAPDGTVRGEAVLGDRRPDQLAVVFDGEAYLAVWKEYDAAALAHRFVAARIHGDGVATPPEIVFRFPEGGRQGAFELATDGAGGSLLTWTRERDWRSPNRPPGELVGLHFHNGILVEAEPVVLAGGTLGGCVSEAEHVLVHTPDGFRALLPRYRCTSDSDDHGLRDLVIAGDGTVTESASPLPFDTLPTFIAGDDGTFVALTRNGLASLVDASLSTLTPVSTEPFTAAAATDTGYVFVAGISSSTGGRTDLVAAGAVPTRLTLATGYLLPDTDGCSTGTRPPLAPAALTFLLLFLRGRRARARGRSTRAAG